uniref:Transport permease protein n=1 Tax=Aggregatibacter actinomycetemcomitans TaxID=714 RepID=W8VT69_AGGAC|nr:ABC transporter permease [Aggregatibacter actinomycetemcomitans]BAO56810.1 ABC transporter [Aggregatibacter actinomycetemcomitans]
MVFSFLSGLFRNKSLLLKLARNDFQAKYNGNLLGILWAFIQPVITILIFWFVFQVGFKSQPVDNFPFILWLIAGMVPWFFIAETISSATNSVLANNFLVKKIVFQVSLLPIVQIISALILHLFFIFFLFGMFLYYGYTPNIYWSQVFYYTFSIIIFLLGLSWLTSSLIVFFKDVGQIVAMVIQFSFWITPIFWSIKILPEEFKFLIELNPFYYIVEGYRDSLIYHVFFWERTELSIQFWSITLVTLGAGVYVFKKLRPHFADVI